MLPISLDVNVQIAAVPALQGPDAFGRGLIIGSSANSRGKLYGIYTSAKGVKAHYGVEANEYKIALRYFAQSPRPKSVMIATVPKP